MSTVIAKLATLQQQRKRRQMGEYDRAVIAAATDSDVEAEDLDAILAAAGRSVAQFEADIERYHERSRLFQQFEERDRWRAEADAHQAELDRIKSEAEEAARQFGEQSRRVNAAKTLAAQKSLDGMAAESFLRRWMPEWLKAEIEPLEAEAREHRGAINKHEKRIDQLSKGVRELTDRKRSGWKNTHEQENDLRHWSEELDRFGRMRAERQTQLEPIEQQLARLRALQIKPWPLPSDLEEE